MRSLDWLPTKGFSPKVGEGIPTHNACVLGAEVEHQVEVAVPIGILNVTLPVSFHSSISVQT